MYNDGHSKRNEGHHEGILGSGGMAVGILNLTNDAMGAYWGVDV